MMSSSSNTESVTNSPRRRPGAIVGRLLVLLVLAGVATAAAGDMRCQGTLVQRGDTPDTVVAACGKPGFVDDWRQDIPNTHIGVPDIVQWYYNAGSSRLVRVLRFRRGRLTDISTAGYGFAVPGPRDCSPGEIVLGMNKYHLLTVCGQPDDTRVLLLLANQHPYVNTAQVQRRSLTPILREYWLYDFGSSRLPRRLTLDSGIVVDIETRSHGDTLDRP